MNANIEVSARSNNESPHIEVLVIYNGVDRRLDANSNAAVKALLEKAIHAFGPLPNPHTLALFTKDGRELNDAQSLKEQGVRDHDQLLLRPSAVKGG